MTTGRTQKCILVTNDDGFDAPGLAALLEAASSLGRAIVVAPDRERSGAGHALTLGRPLRVRSRGTDRYEVDGTPTDCVHLGVFHLTGGRPPDLILSGINRGLNIGDDVTYSGTVAAALEGTLLQVPSIALSAERGDDGGADYRLAAALARRLGEKVFADGLPAGVLLNVNVPRPPVSGIRITRQGTRTYRAAVVERLDPSGRPYFWIAGADTTPAGEADGDHAAIRERWVSVTPLHANMTHGPSMGALGSWALTLP